MNALRTLLLTSLILSGVQPAIADELVSFDLVRESSGSLEARMPYEASTAIRVGDSLELLSAEGYDFGLRVSKTKMSSLGNRIIHASTDGGGKAVIVIDDAGALLGSIEDTGRHYSLLTNELGKSVVAEEVSTGEDREVDFVPRQSDATPAFVGLGLELDGLDTENITGTPQQSAPADGVIYPEFDSGKATISVLIYHDSGLTNVNSVIDYVFELTNIGFANSGLEIELEFAGKKELAELGGNEDPRSLSDKMYSEEYPFGDIASDRRLYEADLVVSITSGHVGDYCGWAPWLGVYDSNPYRSRYVAAVDWQPDTSQSSFCYRSTFAHEIGHLLGGMHQYSNYDGSVVGAFSYSHAYERMGVFRTIMTPAPSENPLVGRFSSPDATCEGYVCGVSGQSDNTRTFKATGHLVAGFEGDGFSYALVKARKIQGDDYDCEKDGLDGFWDAPALRNQSKYDIEVASFHFVRPDGSEMVVNYDRGERYIGSGVTGWNGWCVTDENQTRLRTEYTQTYARYYHPITDKVVQAESLIWDENYDGRYVTIRVATSDGGGVQGHPAQSVEGGSSRTINFVPESGYAIAEIQSTCSGRKSGNSYTVDVGQDDCFVEATFNQVAVGETLRVSIETPADGQVYNGIGTFQGWAVAQEGIDRVDLYVDGAFFQSAPYGGARGDVGNVFPDVPNSSNSGYALAFNYGNLSEGTHTLRAVAVTEDGRTLESSSSFSVTKFHKPFIGPQDTVSLDGASCSVQGSQISVVDALIDGKSYDISLEWRTGTQGFEIYRIR